MKATNKLICKKLNGQRLDGTKYRAKNNWIEVKRQGKVWLPITEPLYYAMRDQIQAEY